jgi:hypothetical protein
MASATVSKTASASKSAELRALLNPPDRSCPAAAALPPSRPLRRQAAPAAAPAAEPIKTPSAAVKSVTVDGFTLTLFAGDVPENLVKANVTRATTNPWYPSWSGWLAASQGMSRFSGTTILKKSPMSQIDGAIARCRKAGMAHYGKLDARSGATKGTWYLIRRA